MPNWKKISRLLLPASLFFSLAACESPGDGCSWVRHISVSPGDSLVRATKEQIIAHNRAVARFCR